MKKIKKFAAFLTALVTIFAMSVSSLAATIEVTGGQEGQVYYAYLIFDLEASGTSYVYTIDADSQFTDLVLAYASDTSNGMTLTAHYESDGTTIDYYVVTVTENAEENNYDPAAFAAYLKAAIDADIEDGTNLYTATTSATAADTGSGDSVSEVVATLTASSAGYYFINSNLGSLAILYSATDTVEVDEKNSVPGVDKTVSETENGTYDSSATATIGEDAYYNVDVSIGKGENAYNIIVTDTLSKGLTFNPSSLSITDSASSIEWTADTDYTLSYSTDADTGVTTVTITLKSASNNGTRLSALADYSTVYISYTATLNEYAVLSGGKLYGNTNEVYVTYGRDSSYKTNTDTTDVYTFRFGVQKVNDVGTQLSGAVFQLTDSDGNIIYVVSTTGSTASYNYYRVATQDEIDDGSASSTITSNAGTTENPKTIFWIEGLAAGTYTLTEIDAPEGYAQLVGSITVTIKEDGTRTFSATNSSDSSLISYSDDSAYVTVTNKTGSAIPSTGGMGTKIFYTLGGILVVCAGVLLVTKKRMSSVK